MKTTWMIIAVFGALLVYCWVLISQAQADTTAVVKAQAVKVEASAYGLEQTTGEEGASLGGTVSRYGLEINTHHGATDFANSFAGGATSVDLTYEKNAADLIGLTRFDEAGALNQYTAEQCQRQAWGAGNRSRATEIHTRMGAGEYDVASPYGDRMWVHTASDESRVTSDEESGVEHRAQGEQWWRLGAEDYTDLAVRHYMDEFAAGDTEDEIGIKGLCAWPAEPAGLGD